MGFLDKIGESIHDIFEDITGETQFKAEQSRLEPHRKRIQKLIEDPIGSRLFSQGKSAIETAAQGQRRSLAGKPFLTTGARGAASRGIDEGQLAAISQLIAQIIAGAESQSLALESGAPAQPLTVPQLFAPTAGNLVSQFLESIVGSAGTAASRNLFPSAFKQTGTKKDADSGFIGARGTGG
jgi:hypothetical protein